MREVLLAGGKIPTTELCLGTLTMGRLQRQLSADEGGEVVKRVLELGVRFVDTAQSYGTYEQIGKALEAFHPEDLVIASKSHARTGEDMRKAVAEACRVMGLEKVDIFHLHLVRSAQDLEERRGALEALLDAREAGRVTAVAASVHTLEGLRTVIEQPEIQVVFPVVNRRGLGIRDGSIEEELPLLREARARGKSIYAMKPLGGGHLCTDAEAALRWVRSLAEVDAVSVGMKSTSEVEMNVCIFNDEPVPAELRAAVESAPKRVIVYPMCRGCGQCVEACDQGAVKLEDEKAVVDQELCILCGYCAENCPEFAIRVI